MRSELSSYYTLPDISGVPEELRGDHGTLAGGNNVFVRVYSDGSGRMMFLDPTVGATVANVKGWNMLGLHQQLDREKVPPTENFRGLEFGGALKVSFKDNLNGFLLADLDLNRAAWPGAFFKGFVPVFPGARAQAWVDGGFDPALFRFKMPESLRERATLAGHYLLTLSRNGFDTGRVSFLDDFAQVLTPIGFVQGPMEPFAEELLRQGFLRLWDGALTWRTVGTYGTVHRSFIRSLTGVRERVLHSGLGFRVNNRNRTPQETWDAFTPYLEIPA